MSELESSGQGVTDPVVDESTQVATEETLATEQQQEQQTGKSAVEYTDFTVPEGMELNAEVLDQFKPFAQELGLNQEQAQKLVDMGADLAGKMQQLTVENWQKQTSEWAEQVKADKEIGGKEFDANIGVALKAIETFGTPELKTLLDESGIGNHPEIVRFAYKIGKAIGEDNKLVAGKASQKDILKVMYPTMNQ